MTTPATPSQRVAKARQKALSNGSRMLHRVMLTPPAADALARLVESGYADSATGAVTQALIEAARGLTRA